MPAVISSNLPAPLPKPEMAGMINPSIINGMAKFRNCPKNELKVANIRLMDSGKYNPKTMPNTIAINTLNNRLENRLFILLAGIAVKRQMP